MKPNQDLILMPNTRTPGYAPPPSPSSELTISELCAVLARRRTVLLGLIGVFFAIAIFICVFSTRRYTATAEIQVQKESETQLILDSPAGSDKSASDAVQDNISIQTQSSILQTDSLALKVIHDLKLDSTDDFKPKFDVIAWLLSPLSGPSDIRLGPSEASDMGFSPHERMRLLSIFSKYLTVKPVSGTRLIDITYTSSNPRVAAEVANRLAQGLIDFNFQTRHSATERMANYLTGQLADLRKQSEELQSKLAIAQRSSGILSLGGVDDQGRAKVYSAVLDKLQQATTAYTQAQANRVAKEAVYQATRTGDAETISSLSAAGTAFTASGSDTSLTLIQGLRLQQATLKGQLAEASAKFGPGYPKLGEMQQNLDAINGSIATAVARMAERAQNDATVADQVEARTRRIYLDLKAEADALNDKTTEYAILRQEADQSRSLYETVFKQLKAAGVLADFKLSNVSIVDPARVPAKPSKPNVPIYLAASLLVGLFAGSCAALFRDSTDNRVGTTPEVLQFEGVTSLGVLPLHPQRRRDKGLLVSAHGSAQLAAVDSLNDITRASGPFSEALRTIRTLLTTASAGHDSPRVILVTSSVAGEGKSTLSANLAVLMAQQGRNVLLVDGDLRGPKLHKHFGLTDSGGLTSMLTSGLPVTETAPGEMLANGIPGLHIMPGGPVTSHPAELLSSKKMGDLMQLWRAQYDFVIIDSAPVLPVTDSVLLSRLVDLTVVVARCNFTEKPWLERTCSLLRSGEDRKVAVLLNGLEPSSPMFRRYYGGSPNSAYYGRLKNVA